MDRLRQCALPGTGETCQKDDLITRIVNTANESIRNIAVPVAQFAFCAAVPALLICLSSGKFRMGTAQMLKEEFFVLLNQKGLRKFLRTGATASLIRGGIEIYGPPDKDKERKGLEESLQGVLWAFLLGGLGGCLSGQIPALNIKSHQLKRIGERLLPVVASYHFSILDLFGEFAQRRLVNIREREGDQKGLFISAAALVGTNVVGLFLIRPFKKGWGAAFLSGGMILFFDTLLEAYVQQEGGRGSWRDLDTGRVVGANLWGYVGLFLPSVILSNRKRSGGFFVTAVTVLELCLKNFFFVAPSLNNFNARLNGMNWNNAVLGHEVRHGTMMWLSQVGQVLFKPSSPLAIISDYTTTIGGGALVNERISFYEGVEEIWRDGYLRRIQRIGAARNESGKKAACDELTRYLSYEMGRREFFKDKYLPSTLNLEKLRQRLTRKENEEEERRVALYLSYLMKKRGERTEQEEVIFSRLTP